MLYLYRIFQAVFRPRQLAAKVECTHAGSTHSQLVDVGMDKLFWCAACRASWFATPGRAS